MRILVAVLLLAATARAAFEERPFSARAAALGEAMAGVSSGPDAAYYNPAALRFAEGAALTSGYTRLFNEDELAQGSLGAVLPTARRGAFGLSATSFGSSLYRETEAAVAWAGRVAPRASLGVALKGQDLRMERYGRLGAAQIDAGLFGKPHQKVGAGVAVKNLTQSGLGRTVESPPAMFSAGLSAELFPGGLTALAAAQESGGRATWRAGQEVRPHPALALRAGFETGPNRFALGAGFQAKGIRLDYALLTHADLPDQHQVNVSFFLGPPRGEGNTFLSTPLPQAGEGNIP
jgi:hypothetical protein